jgi:hypothetical protein
MDPARRELMARALLGAAPAQNNAALVSALSGAFTTPGQQNAQLNDAVSYGGRRLPQLRRL